MSKNFIEFSKITLINDNIKKEVDEKFNSKEKFQAELDRLKNRFNKLRLSTEDIIKKKNLNFKEFLKNDLNIQLSNSNTELTNKKNKLINNTKNNENQLLNTSLKRTNISEKIETVNGKEKEKDNVIVINNEKDNNSYVSLDKNIYNLTISSIKDNYFSSNDNNISNNNENNLILNKNNSNISFNTNLFVVKIKNNKNITKQYLGNKHNGKDKSNNNNKPTNKKENLVSQISTLFNKIKNIADKYRNYFHIEEKNDNRTIFIENKKKFDIYLFKGKINRIYSYENKIYSNKEKDIIKQLNIIQDNFEKKIISLGLNNNDLI